VEWTEKKPESDMEFSYFGEHYVLKIPDDVVPDGLEDRTPEFFELQIKTLFQHAWSETSHDIGYKAPRDLNSLERRKLAFSAAQAWGADQIFKELEADIVANDDD
jgi:ppGpp synthetase/RelA/SpoT-type nucleotidyltranferase